MASELTSENLDAHLTELAREVGYNGYGDFDEDEEFQEQYGDGDSVEGLIGYKDSLEELVGRLVKEREESSDGRESVR